MNRGVIAYMREGNRCAKNTFKNFGNILKFYFLHIVSFFGSIFIFPIPMMTLARMRVARLAERDEDIQIFKSFEKTDSSKHFWTIFAFYFMKFILFLAGIIFIVLLAGLFGGIGILIGGAGTPGFIVGGIFAAPFALVLVLFLILFPFMLEPAIYLYDCNTNLGLSGMFYNSIDAMRKTGKWTTFMLTVLYSLRHLLWLVLIGGSGALLYLYYDQTAIRILSAIALLVFLVLYFFKGAKLLLGRRVARVLLLNDICSTEKYVSLEPNKEENTPKNVYGVSKRTLRAAKKEQLLLGLFTNGPKLKDPEGVDQSRLPNEVDDEIEEETLEEEVLAKPVPENVVEIQDNKNPDPEQPKPVYENTRQIVVSTDPEDPTNMKVSKMNTLESRFTGRAIGYFGMKLLTTLLSVISFGIAVPWTTCMMEKWYAKHTYINGKRLRFDGRGGALFGKYILWFLLTIVTLGIYGFWLSLNMQKWVSKHTHIADENGESKLETNVFAYTGINILTGLLKIVTLGIAGPWAECIKERWLAKRTIIDGHELRFEGRGAALFGKNILWMFLTIITFGIFAFSYTIRVRKWKTKNKHFVVVERNLTNIEEIKEKAAETYDRPMADFNDDFDKQPEQTQDNLEQVETPTFETPVVEEKVEELESTTEESNEEPVIEQFTNFEEELETVIEEPVIEQFTNFEEELETVIEEPVQTTEPNIEELLSKLSNNNATTEEPVVEEVQEVTKESVLSNETNIEEILNKLSNINATTEEPAKPKRGRKKATESESDN